MLSINPHPDHPRRSTLSILNSARKSTDLSFLTAMAIGSGTASSPVHPTKLATQNGSVAQALEIARESPDGASDPTVRNILENAISRVWSSILAQPDSYVMTRDEFAVFNYFQHRFDGNQIAQQARKRYWDNVSA